MMPRVRRSARAARATSMRPTGSAGLLGAIYQSQFVTWARVHNPEGVLPTWPL
jgi:hypothetical protein